VLKAKKAITETASHPTIPLISADFFQIISMHRITAIGNKVSKKDQIDLVYEKLKFHTLPQAFNY